MAKKNAFNQDFHYPYPKKQKMDLKGAGAKNIDFTPEEMPNVILPKVKEPSLGKPQKQTSKVVSTRDLPTGSKRD